VDANENRTRTFLSSPPRPAHLLSVDAQLSMSVAWRQEDTKREWRFVEGRSCGRSFDSHKGAVSARRSRMHDFSSAWPRQQSQDGGGGRDRGHRHGACKADEDPVDVGVGYENQRVGQLQG